MNYRQGHIGDLEKIKQLAITSWSPFQSDLTTENWQKLFHVLSSDNTYLELLQNSHCILCETTTDELIGMAFLVSSGHPTKIFDEKWAYIRFVSVNPLFGGQGIGTQLTQQCIDLAKHNNEQTIALHTSEIMGKARHIYESLGFKILREIEPSLGKKYWLYTLNLTHQI